MPAICQRHPIFHGPFAPCYSCLCPEEDSLVLAVAAAAAEQERSLILIGLSHLFLEAAQLSCWRPMNEMTPKGCDKL